MPHFRQRLGLSVLKKKLSFFPVVVIQGARQTGKSTLARSMLPNKPTDFAYYTFDDYDLKQDALKSPSSFVKRENTLKKMMIVDEAQKAPPIFDAVKYVVDQNKKPGQFLLLGSTAFSHLIDIRESLTGRMGRIQLYPMTLQESLNFKKQPYTRTHTLKYLENGGMPGIFAVHDSHQKDQLIQDLLELVCFRDLFQFKKVKLDGELAYLILKQCAILEYPTKKAIAKVLAVDGRVIDKHLTYLRQLFFIHRLKPHPSGFGEDVYLLIDPGIAFFLDAPIIKRLQIALLNERLAYNSYCEIKRSQFYFYKGRGENCVDLIEDSPKRGLCAFALTEHEKVLKTHSELLRSFLKKNPAANATLYAPINQPHKEKSVSIEPWENLFT